MDIQQNVRTVLTNINMIKVAEVSGISYNTLMNFRKGRKAYLTEEELETVIETIKKITFIVGR